MKDDNRKIELDNEMPGEQMLMCPTCDEWYLHQKEARLLVRDREDGPATLTEVSRGQVRQTRLTAEEAGRFGSRRDTYQLLFYCEFCHGERTEARHVMSIRQHKGHTYMSWERMA